MEHYCSWNVVYAAKHTRSLYSYYSVRVENIPQSSKQYKRYCQHIKYNSINLQVAIAAWLNKFIQQSICRFFLGLREGSAYWDEVFRGMIVAWCDWLSHRYLSEITLVVAWFCVLSLLITTQTLYVWYIFYPIRTSDSAIWTQLGNYYMFVGRRLYC